MAVTALEISRIRRDTGTDATSLPDATIQEIFDEAAEIYTDANSALYYTRVAVITGLLSSSARLSSYRQNESSENLSDVFKHLQSLLELWQGKLDTAVTLGTVTSAARFGGTRRKPASVKEYPGWP